MRLLKIFFDVFALYRIIVHNWSLLLQFVKRNIAVRYRGSMLGLVWSFVQPLMMLCVYTFVFSVVFKARWGVDTGDSRGAFAIIMFCGMALYNIFSESVNINCGVIVSNPNFVKKVIFPLEILPLAQTVSSFVLGTVWFILLFLGVVFIFGKVSFMMLLLPLVLLPLFFFALGISYFVASLGVYVRDTSYVVQVVLQILFFMTPIFLSDPGGSGAFPLAAAAESSDSIDRGIPESVSLRTASRLEVFGIGISGFTDRSASGFCMVHEDQEGICRCPLMM